MNGGATRALLDARHLEAIGRYLPDSILVFSTFPEVETDALTAHVVLCWVWRSGGLGADGTRPDSARIIASISGRLLLEMVQGLAGVVLRPGVAALAPAELGGGSEEVEERLLERSRRWVERKVRRAHGTAVTRVQICGWTFTRVGVESPGRRPLAVVRTAGGTTSARSSTWPRSSAGT